VTEAERTTQFLKYAKAKIKFSFVFEAKICKSKSMSFTAVKPHQERALKIANESSFSYKIPDVGYDQKPFDGFQFYKTDAYVVIFWYMKKGDTRFSMIDIKVWLEEKERSDRKSITYERACEIAKLSDTL
jgi:hypothetical protein